MLGNLRDAREIAARPVNDRTRSIPLAQDDRREQSHFRNPPWREPGFETVNHGKERAREETASQHSSSQEVGEKGVRPHPDDLEFGMAWMFQALAENGTDAIVDVFHTMEEALDSLSRPPTTG